MKIYTVITMIYEEENFMSFKEKSKAEIYLKSEIGKFFTDLFLDYKVQPYNLIEDIKEMTENFSEYSEEGYYSIQFNEDVYFKLVETELKD